jgi:hypothetical protein
MSNGLHGHRWARRVFVCVWCCRALLMQPSAASSDVASVVRPNGYLAQRATTRFEIYAVEWRRTKTFQRRF